MAELHSKLARGPLAGAAPAAVPIAEAKRIHLPFPEFNAIAIDPEVADVVLDESFAVHAHQIHLEDNVLLYGSDTEVGSTPAVHREAVLEYLSDLVLDAASVSERTMYEQLLARALFRARLL